LWVPPSSTSAERPDAIINAGNTVCSTSVVLPAVAITNA
jgi:hypothetical protein